MTATKSNKGKPAVQAVPMHDNGVPYSAPSPLHGRSAMAMFANAPRTKDGRLILSPEQLVQSLLSSYSRVLVSSDVSLREDRILQRRMRNDPDVSNPLEQRLLAVALMDFEVKPENDKDPAQVERAAAMTRAIKRIPRVRQLFRWLGLAVWYGHSGCNLTYGDLGDQVVSGLDEGQTPTQPIRFAPVNWLPIHPDSMLFDFDGQPVIKINRFRVPEMAKDQVVLTPEAPAIRLTPDQRAAIVLNVYNIEAANFEEPYEAASPYAGVGLRSTLWYYWFLKQRFLQMMTRFSERLGGGTLMGYYTSGNDKLKGEIESAMLSLMEDVAVAIPRETGEAKDTVDIKILEPNGSGFQLFGQMLKEYFQKAIMQAIIGQELTMTSEATGLGSGLAEIHKESFYRVIDYDRVCLEETLTNELVAPMVRVNYPGATERYEFAFASERVNIDEYLKSIETFTRMGGVVSENDVRNKLGFVAPEDGEGVLGGMMGGLDLGLGDDGNAAFGRTLAQMARMAD